MASVSLKVHVNLNNNDTKDYGFTWSVKARDLPEITKTIRMFNEKQLKFFDAIEIINKIVIDSEESPVSKKAPGGLPL